MKVCEKDEKADGNMNSGIWRYIDPGQWRQRPRHKPTQEICHVPYYSGDANLQWVTASAHSMQTVFCVFYEIPYITDQTPLASIRCGFLLVQRAAQHIHNLLYNKSTANQSNGVLNLTCMYLAAFAGVINDDEVHLWPSVSFRYAELVINAAQ